MRQSVKKELRAEMAADVQKQAALQAAKEVRAKDEEVREANRQIAALKRQVTNLSKKLPPSRAQALGDVRQETLAGRLATRCPQDEIAAVPRGVRGADVIQSVRDPSGRVCGTIVWESKRAANWNRSWVTKLRDDLRRGNHTIGVIVSDALPDPDSSLTEIDGIWITNIDVAGDLAVILRDSVIQVASARGARARRDDLKGRAYDYLAGPQFASHIHAVIESAQAMRGNLELERRALQVRWGEREQHINAVVLELASIYGDLRGIGAALPTIEILELPQTDSSLELPPA